MTRHKAVVVFLNTLLGKYNMTEIDYYRYYVLCILNDNVPLVFA